MKDPMPDLEAFNKRLTTIATGLPAQAVTTLQKKLTLDIFSGCVKRTPVDKGRARGGWQITIGEPAKGEGTPEPEGTIGSPTGQTYTKGLNILGTIPNFSILWVSNNVPYITVLDQGGFVPTNPGPSEDKRPGRYGKILVSDGYSIQAPNGIVGLAIQDAIREFS